MSSFNQNSNPFHQYDTRYKPILPERTNAFIPSWYSNNTISNTTTFNTNNYTTTVTYSGTNNVPTFTTTYYTKK